MLENKRLENLLEDIKRLLILDLSSKGIQGKIIANILEVDPAVISRMLSLHKNKVKK